MTTQRWGSLLVPLEGLVDYGYYEIICHAVSDRIVSVLTGVDFVDHIGVYAMNFIQVPDHYVEHGNEMEFYAEVTSELRTQFNYNESLPGYLNAMNILSFYLGHDFHVADMNERGIMVLVEAP
ncbi:hypothetical protein JOAD_47 [Erwinia phage vB_EamM_Joad]|uniref:Uncharacterized protein n=1 Tax=Erwinia phage vB_EamM_Joad TaxID=2026081 RepID=A0A223LJC4_9CAUD|nr:hypothetical protein JOAD_47 [Erwinia phage vB_EamM_Joad]